MKKNLLIIVILFLIQSAFSDDQTIRALIRIEKKINHINLATIPQVTSLTTVFSNEEVKEKMSHLEVGSDAIVEGKIMYHFSRIEGSHFSHPYFVINKVIPISLKSLGDFEIPKIENSQSILPKKIDYIPPSIPITTEVASAITLTTSVLLMNELTSSQSSGLNKDLTATLFLTTGIFATILFIYEQIEGKNK